MTRLLFLIFLLFGCVLQGAHNNFIRPESEWETTEDADEPAVQTLPTIQELKQGGVAQPLRENPSVVAGIHNRQQKIWERRIASLADALIEAIDEARENSAMNLIMSRPAVKELEVLIKALEDNSFLQNFDHDQFEELDIEAQMLLAKRIYDYLHTNNHHQPIPAPQPTPIPAALVHNYEPETLPQPIEFMPTMERPTPGQPTQITTPVSRPRTPTPAPEESFEVIPSELEEEPIMVGEEPVLFGLPAGDNLDRFITYIDEKVIPLIAHPRGHHLTLSMLIKELRESYGAQGTDLQLKEQLLDYIIDALLNYIKRNHFNPQLFDQRIGAFID